MRMSQASRCLSTMRPARAIIIRGLWCHRRVDLRGRLMARRQYRMLPLGTAAPRFALRDTMSGRTVAPEDFVSSPALLIAFMCNHCPFVKHILDGFVAFARDFAPRGLAVVAIRPNDVEGHPGLAPVRVGRIA